MIKEIYNEYTGCSTEDLGAKILPTNLNEAIKEQVKTEDGKKVMAYRRA